MWENVPLFHSMLPWMSFLCVLWQLSNPHPLRPKPDTFEPFSDAAAIIQPCCKAAKCLKKRIPQHMFGRKKYLRIFDPRFPFQPFKTKKKIFSFENREMANSWPLHIFPLLDLASQQTLLTRQEFKNPSNLPQLRKGVFLNKQKCLNYHKNTQSSLPKSPNSKPQSTWTQDATSLDRYLIDWEKKTPHFGMVMGSTKKKIQVLGAYFSAGKALRPINVESLRA